MLLDVEYPMQPDLPEETIMTTREPQPFPFSDEEEGKTMEGAIGPPWQYPSPRIHQQVGPNFRVKVPQHGSIQVPSQKRTWQRCATNWRLRKVWESGMQVR